MTQKAKILTSVTIAIAGTRQQITSTDMAVYSVVIQADLLNTGNVYIGDSIVSSSNGIELAAGDSYIVEAQDLGDQEINLSDFYVDTDTNGNVVRIQYLGVRGS